MTTNHSTTASALTLVFAAFASIIWSQICLAQEPHISAPAVEPARPIYSIPLVPHQALKSIPSKFEIYQYDNSPLGGRQPLLLIHGLLGEHWPLFRWQQLTQYLSADQAFQQRYKIYLARYNTNSSMKDVTEVFNLALRDLRPSGLTIVAISMSGNIVREAMKDPAVDQSISRVLTLGAFFRGSPLFCPDWMQQSIRKGHLSPLCQIDRLVAYKLYFARHKNMLADYGWDNVDGQMPAVKFSREHQELRSQPSPQQDFLNAARQPSDQKFVVYAGYLHNRYTHQSRSAVRAFLLSPFTFVWTTLPAQCGREHAALRFINHLIAESIPATADGAKIIYPFNDGISPISSSLLLSNDFVAHSAPRNKEDIANITTHSYAKKARLFENIDHRTFIDGTRSIGSSADIADVLIPTEQPRSMFAWILKDLLE